MQNAAASLVAHRAEPVQQAAARLSALVAQIVRFLRFGLALVSEATRIAADRARSNIPPEHIGGSRRMLSGGVRRIHRPHLGHRGRPLVVQFTRVPHGQNPKALQTLRQ
jgi:hypothetical protein